MRLLTDEEVMLVAGGTSSSETITGPGPFWPDPWDPWDPTLPDDPYGGGGGGGGQGGDVHVAAWGGWTGGAVDAFLANYLPASGAGAAAREAQVYATFDAANATGQVSGSNHDGVAAGWAMADGSAFFDTNGNGTVDLHMMTDAAGNVWADTGAGYQLVRAA